MFRGSVVLFLLGLIGLMPVCAAEVSQGAAEFLSNCAFCHAVNGRGGRGPSLVSSRVVENTSDDAIRAIIKNGIPGTGMPAFDIAKESLDLLVLHIRSLGGSGAKPTVPTGDPAHGEALYTANGCANCHRLGGRGSVFGPELTRIGSSRSPEYLRESLVNPSADIAPEYEGVRVVMPDGKGVTGVRINEDNFSVQMRLSNQQFLMLDKAKVTSVQDLKTSLMPSYKTMSGKDLDDLVAYLASLRSESKGMKAIKAPEIH